MAATMNEAFLNAGFNPVKPRKEHKPKIQKCRKCGGPMEFKKDTNLLVCLNDIETKNENGDVKFVPCGNVYIFNVK